MLLVADVVIIAVCLSESLFILLRRPAAAHNFSLVACTRQAVSQSVSQSVDYLCSYGVPTVCLY